MTGSDVSLIVAGMDLKMVQGVIRAMRAADIAGAKTKPPIDRYNETHATRRFDEVQPRRVIHPTPEIAPRRVIHPTPRVEPTPALPAVDRADEIHSHITPSPIQPPWKVLLWNQPVQSPPIVKQIVQKTDILNKGTLLDLVV